MIFQLLILLVADYAKPCGRAADTVSIGPRRDFVPSQWYVVGIGEAPGENFFLCHRMGQTIEAPLPWTHLTNASFWLHQPPGVFQPSSLDLVIYEFETNRTIGPELFRSRTLSTTGLMIDATARVDFEVGFTLQPYRRYLLLLDPVPYFDGVRSWVQVASGTGRVYGNGGLASHSPRPTPQPIHEIEWFESSWQDAAFRADFTRPPPSQRLEIRALVGQELMLTWSTNLTGFQLEMAANPRSLEWAPVTNDVSTTDHIHYLRLPANAPSQFFRLRSVD